MYGLNQLSHQKSLHLYTTNLTHCDEPGYIVDSAIGLDLPPHPHKRLRLGVHDYLICLCVDLVGDKERSCEAYKMSVGFSSGPFSIIVCM